MRSVPSPAYAESEKLKLGVRKETSRTTLAAVVLPDQGSVLIAGCPRNGFSQDPVRLALRGTPRTPEETFAP